MLWSWKLHPSPIIVSSQLGFLIKSALSEKLLQASFLSATLFGSWVSGFIGFYFYLFQSQNCSQLSPYWCLMIPDLSYFSEEKKNFKKRKTWWLPKSVYIYRKCLNMFATFKVLAEKAFEILQDFIFMILQNSCFTFMRASFFTLSSRVQLSSHYKSNILMLGDSPLFLQCLSAMLSFLFFFF